MLRILRGTVLLAGAIFMTTGIAMAQNYAPSARSSNPFSADFAVTYAPEHARIVQKSCDCFWLQGVSGDVSLSFYHGLGLAVSLAEGTSSHIQPGVNLSKFTVAAGPRYTKVIDHWSRNEWAQHPAHVFVQGLFGEVHGYNSVFPAAGGATSTANSSSMQLGGGVDLFLTRHIGVRLFEMDWIRTALPNGASNTQNDLRVAAGLTYHVGRN